MSAKKGDPCGYCPGTIEDGDDWESKHTTTLMRGEVYGADEVWGLAIEHLKKRAGDAFVQDSGLAYGNIAQVLRELFHDLRKLREKDVLERRQKAEEHARVYGDPLASAAKERGR